MDSMLKEILEAEKRAREAFHEAEKYKADALAEIEEEKKRIISERLADAQTEVEKLREEHHKSVADAMKAKEADADASIAAMKELEKNKHDEWVSEIFNKVISDEA